MHKMYLKSIIEKGSKEDMEKLGEMFNKSIDHLKECDPELYNKMEIKLYTLVNGKTFNEEMARDIINDMRPYGMKWSLEESKQVQSQYGLTNINDMDFWVVINSAYNDYKNIFDDNIEMYAMFTKDFIMDEDASKDKVWNYFCEIVKK